MSNTKDLPLCQKPLYNSLMKGKGISAYYYLT